MARLKLAILHFAPLEFYPPVMNFINCWGAETNEVVKVYTTVHGGSNIFSNKFAQILRLGKLGNSSLKRYCSYLYFNLVSFFSIMYNRPQSIFVYETISILPAYLMSRWNSSIKIYIHYHEYISPEEMVNTSRYMKFLFGIEKKLFNRVVWISHTNEKRMELFSIQHPELKDNIKRLMPNYPPSNWHRKVKSKNDLGKINMVYAGAIGLQSTYIKEIISFVKNHEKFILHIYSNNIDIDAMNFLKENLSNRIHLKGSVGYYELPSIYAEYDIGLILYKGLTPNYVYNAPNKLFEYLVCGLEVWYPKEMVGCFQYQSKIFPKVIEINFENLKIDVENQIFHSQKYTDEKTLIFNCESIYKTIIKDQKEY
jgi:hypothetical protein